MRLRNVGEGIAVVGLGIWLLPGLAIIGAVVVIIGGACIIASTFG